MATIQNLKIWKFGKKLEFLLSKSLNFLILDCLRKTLSSKTKSIDQAVL